MIPEQQSNINTQSSALNKKICSLLTNTYSGRDNQQITNAESQLLQLTQNPEFILNLVKIITESEQPLIVQAASNYLSKYAIAVLLKQPNIAPKRDFCSLVISKIFKHPGLHITYKKISSKALKILIDKNKDKNKQLRKLLCEEFSIQLVNLSKMDQAQSNLFENIALLGSVLFDNKYDAMVAQLIDASLPALFTLTATVVNSAVMMLSNYSPQYQDYVLRNMFIVQELSEVILKIISRQDIGRKQVFKKLVENDTILEYVSICFKLKSHITNNNFILTDDSKLSRLINQTRANALAVLYISYESILKLNRAPGKSIAAGDPNPIHSLRIYIQVPNIFKLLLSSMKTMIETNVNINALSNQSAILVVEQIIRLFSLLVEESEFNDLYSSHLHVLVYKFIQPLFATILDDPTQKTRFIENPEEFLQYWVTVLDSLTSLPHVATSEDEMTLHILAAKLLLKMSKYVDNCTSTLFNNIQASLNDFKVPLKIRIADLLFAGILAPRIGIRKDLSLLILKTIQTLVETSTYSTTSPQTEQHVLHALSFVVMARYQAQIRTTIRDVSLQLLQLSLSILYREHPLCVQNPALFQANLHLLFALFKNESSVIMNLPNKVLEHIINSINLELDTPVRMVDVLLQLLRDNPNYSNEQQLILKCIRELVRKVASLTDYIVKEPVENATTRRYLQMINKCCNVLRLLICNRQLSSSFIPAIQAELVPLVRYVQSSATQIQFDEDLLIFVISCVSITKTVSPFQLEFINYFPIIFKKYRFNLHKIFNAINLLVKYGGGVIKDSPKAQETILYICMQSISAALSKQITQADKASGVLMLTGFIVGCGRCFPKEVWRVIIDTLLSQLNDYTQKFEFYQSNCLALAVSIAFSSLQYLQVTALMDKVLFYYEDIHCQYASKVLVIAMCEMLREIQSTDLSMFLKVCLTCLSKLLRKKNKEKSDMQENEDGDDNLQREQEEYQQIAASLNNQLTDINVFDYFKDCVSHLRTNRVWSESIANLSPELQECLKQVMQVQNIGDGQYRVIFRINRKQ